jgi:hypothetical protein
MGLVVAWCFTRCGMQYVSILIISAKKPGAQSLIPNTDAFSNQICTGHLHAIMNKQSFEVVLTFGHVLHAPGPRKQTQHDK